MNLKKLLCLLLALVMVLSLAACSDSDDRRNDDDDDDDEEISEDKDKNKDDEDEDKDDEPAKADTAEDILGAWTFDISLTEDMTGMDGFEIDDLAMRFTFLEDGTMTLTFDEAAITRMEEELFTMMEEMIYSQLEEQGMKKEEIDAAFEEAYGMSVTDYINSYMEEADIASSLTALEETIEYEIDGDTLTLDGTEMTFEIDGDKLTITACEDDEFWSEVGLEVPVVMKRVK